MQNPNQYRRLTRRATSQRDDSIERILPPHLVECGDAGIKRSYSNPANHNHLRLETNLVLHEWVRPTPRKQRCIARNSEKTTSLNRTPSGIRQSVIIITQRFDFIDSSFSLRRYSTSWIKVRDIDNSLSLDKFDGVLPAVPIVFILDQEANQHTRVHLSYVQSAKPPSMTRVDVLVTVLSDIFVEWQRRPGIMWIEVKQIGTRLVVISRSLCADKVVRSGRASSIERQGQY